MIVYVRFKDVPEGQFPKDQQVEAMTKALTKGLTPGQLGGKYFPNVESGRKPSVDIKPFFGNVPEKRGWATTCYVPEVTVTATASRAQFQEALNRVNEDSYRNARKTGGVVALEELPIVDNRKPGR